VAGPQQIGQGRDGFFYRSVGGINSRTVPGSGVIVSGTPCLTSGPSGVTDSQAGGVRTSLPSSEDEILLESLVRFSMSLVMSMRWIGSRHGPCPVVSLCGSVAVLNQPRQDDFQTRNSKHSDANRMRNRQGVETSVHCCRDCARRDRLVVSTVAWGKRTTVED
jgi:hypothetical protein